MYTQPSTRYSSLSLGPLMTFKVKPMHKVAGDSQSCNKILSDHAPCECTPALPAAVARATRGQSTCFSVHTWEGGRFQGTETRYLTVIIPEVPSVISGTEIIDFLFFRKWLRGQEYPLHFPWLSLILHIFFKRKINLKRSSYSAGQWSNTAGQGTRQDRVPARVAGFGISPWMTTTAVLSVR